MRQFNITSVKNTLQNIKNTSPRSLLALVRKRTIFASLVLTVVVILSITTMVKGTIDSNSPKKTGSSDIILSISPTPLPSPTPRISTKKQTPTVQSTLTPPNTPTKQPTPSPTRAPTPTLIIKASNPLCVASSIPPETGPAPLTVILHGGGQAVGTESSLVGYQWDFENDGTWDTGVNINAVSHTYTSPGTFEPKYRIQESKGNWSQTCNYPYKIVVTAPTPTLTPTPAGH